MKTAVISGASSGIGLATSLELTKNGYSVIGIGHDPAHCTEAKTKIEAVANGGTVNFLCGDLMQQREVERIAHEIAEILKRDNNDRLDVLINNAGVMYPPKQTTTDGFELQFGTNHLGHVALVGHLMPLLRAGRARVTLQISGAADQGAINWDDLNWERSYDSMGAYSQSKIAHGLFGL